MDTNISLLYIRDVIAIDREDTCVNTVNKSCYVLSVRMSGESTFFYDDRKLTAKTGDILYIPYGATYRQECKQEEVICIHLDGYSVLPDQLLLFKSENTKTICSLFKQCYELWKNKSKKYQYRCMSLLYEILSYTDFSIEKEKKEIPLLNIALRHLNSDMFNTDFSIDALCKKTGISRTYFNRLFKEKIDCLPMEYITEKRIRKAIFLLESGVYTNEEIAWLCGYNDVKYFYVVFKRITGFTTKQYRNIKLQK